MLTTTISLIFNKLTHLSTLSIEKYTQSTQSQNKTPENFENFISVKITCDLKKNYLITMLDY